MSVAVIGSGYVWLIFGLHFIGFQRKAVYIDKKPKKTEVLGCGRVPTSKLKLDDFAHSSHAFWNLIAIGGVAGLDALAMLKEIRTLILRGDGPPDLAHIDGNRQIEKLLDRHVVSDTTSSASSPASCPRGDLAGAVRSKLCQRPYRGDPMNVGWTH